MIRITLTAIDGFKLGSVRDVLLGPISFIFMQFSSKILSNNRFFSRNSGVGAPRLGNPGSATALGIPGPPLTATFLSLKTLPTNNCDLAVMFTQYKLGNNLVLRIGIVRLAYWMQTSGRSRGHPWPKIVSISCSFFEILINSYVDAPQVPAPPPLGNPGSSPADCGKFRSNPSRKTIRGFPKLCNLIWLIG